MSVEIRHMVDAQMGGISAVVAATLNAGYTLGEDRMESGIKYRLFYNGGGASAPVGAVLAPLLGGTGPYTLTVSTASFTNNHLGGCVAIHNTITTGAYFWGAVRGRIGAILGGATSVPTGSVFIVGANGGVEILPQSVVTGAPGVGVNIGGAASKTITSGAKTGDACIAFTEI